MLKTFPTGFKFNKDLIKLRSGLQCLMLTLTLTFLTACVSQADLVILKVGSTEDIPDINQKYDTQLNQLKIGMSKAQVTALFPNMEKECFESGICNFTVFDETYINLLTTSLVSLLGLTCILSKNECNEAIIAALNVTLASSISRHDIQTTSSGNPVLTLLQWINIEFVDGKVTQWAINEPLPQFQPKTFDNKLPSLEDALAL
jgi:hypothetical protein